MEWAWNHIRRNYGDADSKQFRYLHLDADKRDEWMYCKCVGIGSAELGSTDSIYYWRH
jgi:hypothetical protein